MSSWKSYPAVTRPTSTVRKRWPRRYDRCSENCPDNPFSEARPPVRMRGRRFATGVVGGDRLNRERTGVFTSPSSLSCHRSPNCLEHDSVLKNSFVPSSDPCSGAQNPGLVVFWPRLLDVFGLFYAADLSDSDSFNSLMTSR